MLLARAGTHTVTHLIGNAALVLVKHRQELEALRAQPELWPKAMDELLRFAGPVHAVARVATREVVVHGVTVDLANGCWPCRLQQTVTRVGSSSQTRCGSIATTAITSRSVPAFSFVWARSWKSRGTSSIGATRGSDAALGARRIAARARLGMDLGRARATPAAASRRSLGVRVEEAANRGHPAPLAGQCCLGRRKWLNASLHDDAARNRVELVRAQLAASNVRRLPEAAPSRPCRAARP